MNMKLPCLAIVYDRYHKAKNNKKSSIEVRITYNRKQKYISTGIQVYPKEWKEKRNEIVNTSDALYLNKSLSTIVSQVKDIIYDMQKEGNICLSDISRRLTLKRESCISFIEYCKRRAVIRKYKKSKDSQERYDRFLRLFTKYGKIKEFADITEASIMAYDQYLAKRKLQICSKWNNYHRFLNSFINDAIGEGLLHRNPYKWLNIEKGKESEGLKRCLTPEEFKRLSSLKMPTESLNRVKDLFVFQTYTCLSYSDLRNFNAKNITDIKGLKVYVGKRNKTNKEFTIPILQPALQILSKYNNHLPIISNVKYNEYLKAVAQAAGIDKPVSTHWARHIGATMLLNEGVDIKIIAKICGHSSTRITEQVYAKLLDETVVDAIKSIAGRLE